MQTKLMRQKYYTYDTLWTTDKDGNKQIIRRMTRQRQSHIPMIMLETGLKKNDGTTTTSYTYNGLDQLKTSTKEKGTAVEEVRQYDYECEWKSDRCKRTQRLVRIRLMYMMQENSFKSGVRERKTERLL